jgi:hypothetical protein
VRPSSTPRGRAVAALAVFSMVVTWSAPASAGEPLAGTASPKPMLAAATSSPLVVEPAPRAFAQDADAPAAQADDTRSFFRTRKGVAALVLMVAGAGYVAYSIPKDNEKVHSPIR